MTKFLKLISLSSNLAVLPYSCNIKQQPSLEKQINIKKIKAKEIKDINFYQKLISEQKKYLNDTLEILSEFEKNQDDYDLKEYQEWQKEQSSYENQIKTYQDEILKLQQRKE